MEHPDEVYVRAGGQDRILTNVNPQVKKLETRHFGGTEAGRVRKMEKTIHGILLLPAGLREREKRYKTIVHYHGGPEEAWAAGFSRFLV